MIYYFSTFGSRAQTMKFYQALKNYGVSVNIINTPVQANSICSISIQFQSRDLDKVKKLLHSQQFTTFQGIYRYDGNGYKGCVTRAY